MGTDLELASDICVILGALLVIGALWAVWWPLGLVALGLALIALGYAFNNRARAKKAKP